VALRQVLLGCDKPSSEALSLWSRHGVETVVVFGLTETSVTSSLYRWQPGESTDVPIGRPIGGTRMDIVDGRGTTVPMGVVGELLISGEGLGRGYVGRAGETATRYVPDAGAAVSGSASAGARSYRTGDLARWRRDGHLEFLGRSDFQVKLRGFRIELEEVESVLRGQAGVREAVVELRGEGVAAQLVGYVVAEAGGVDFEAIRWQASALLPA
jgi:non-ribosomal peptide synthetase component F